MKKINCECCDKFIPENKMHYRRLMINHKFIPFCEICMDIVTNLFPKVPTRANYKIEEIKTKKRYFNRRAFVFHWILKYDSKSIEEGTQSQ